MTCYIGYTYVSSLCCLSMHGFLDYQLVRMIWSTVYICVISLQSEWACEISNEQLDRRTSCIDCTCSVSSQYEWAYVSLDLTLDWMICCIERVCVSICWASCEYLSKDLWHNRHGFAFGIVFNCCKILLYTLPLCIYYNKIYLLV